ncbi:MAG: hypothetical protein ACRENN_10985 [Candidatus Eiseniibacteriota bacterium]
MQLDDLKEAWAAQGAVLERSLAINERVLREVMLGKTRRALTPYVLWRGVEIALGVVAMFVAMPILAAHVAEPRYLVAGGALAAWLYLVTAMSTYLLVSALRLDYAGPVTSLQRGVERIRLVEYRALKWALLGGVVVWLPGLLVLFEAVTGVPGLARVSLAYLVANLALGLGVLAVGQALSKRYLEHVNLKPWARRLVDAVSGRGLRIAADHLAELSRFERE